MPFSRNSSQRRSSDENEHPAQSTAISVAKDKPRTVRYRSLGTIKLPLRYPELTVQASDVAPLLHPD